MKLSVIIPAFNTENTLNRCVESVLAQECEDMEVVIIDDGSTDSTPSICNQYSSRFGNIKTIHTSNGGLSKARNIGIDNAKGNYITFVDSDDYVENATYKQLLDILEVNGDYDILEYPVFERFGLKKRQHLLTFNEREYSDIKDYWLNAKAYNHAYAWNKIYKRKLFEQVRFPEGMVFEDTFTLPKLLQKCRKITTTDKGLYYYTYNSKGITAQAGGKELTDLLNAHLAVLPEMVDEDYYAAVLNIALDVYELTGTVPHLPVLPYNGSLKLKLLNIIGLKRLCLLNKTMHRLTRVYR